MSKKHPNLSFSSNLKIVCLGLASLTALVGITAYFFSQQTMSELSKVGDDYLPAVQHAIELNFKNAQYKAAIFESFVASDRGDIDRIEQIMQELATLNKEITENLVVFDGLAGVPLNTKNIIQTVAIDLDIYFELGKGTFDLVVAGQKSQAMTKFAEFASSHAAIQKNLANVKMQMVELADLKNRSGKYAQTFFSWTLLVMVSLATLFAFGAVWQLIRKLKLFVGVGIEHISQESGKTFHTSKSLAEAADTLLGITADQAEGVQESVASLEEMGAMTANTKSNAERCVTLADQCVERSKSGLAVVEMMGDAMKRIEEGSKRLSDLQNVILGISEKAKVINSIAFETKLLSFNAAIEAARVGAHGLGFAVVAGEVGKLAGISDSSAVEINSLLTASSQKVQEIVEETQRNVSEGSRITDQCRDVFNQFANDVANMQVAIRDIGNASREQDTAVQEANRVMQKFETAVSESTQRAQHLADEAVMIRRASESVNAATVGLDQRMFGAKNKSAA